MHGGFFKDGGADKGKGRRLPAMRPALPFPPRLHELGLRLGLGIGLTAARRFQAQRHKLGRSCRGCCSRVRAAGVATSI
eukprot:188171-Chlamydomonas_euryale.AAC.1